MSAVVYDVGYDTRMIKKRKNVATVQDIDRPKNIKNSKHTAMFKLWIS